MVFENVTALELHLHTGEEDPVEPIERPERAVSSTEGSDDSSIDRKVLLGAMLVVSVVLSIAVTVIVRKVGRFLESRE